MTTSNTKIIKNGLWNNNPAIVQLLGLCPLLAVSNTAISSITLGIATIIVLTFSNGLIALLKSRIDYNLRIPYFMLIVACNVTCIILLLKAISFELYQSLGVYLALITTNCVILGRIEAFAYKNNISKACLDGAANGLGFSLALFLLGSLREIIGQGTLFANANLLFGDLGEHLVVHIHSANSNFILALLPPGAFFILGILIALKNFLSLRKKNNPYEQRTKISDIRKIPKK